MQRGNLFLDECTCKKYQLELKMSSVGQEFMIWTCSHSPSPHGPGPTFRAIFILATRRRPVRAFGSWFEKRCSRSRKGTGTTKHIEPQGVHMRSDALSNGMGKSLAAIPC